MILCFWSKDAHALVCPISPFAGQAFQNQTPTATENLAPIFLIPDKEPPKSRRVRFEPHVDNQRFDFLPRANDCQSVV